MNLIQDNLRVNIMVTLHHRLISLDMKEDALFQATLMLSIAMGWVLMLLFLLEKVLLDTCLALKIYQIEIQRIGLLLVAHFQL